MDIKDLKGKGLLFVFIVAVTAIIVNLLFWWAVAYFGVHPLIEHLSGKEISFWVVYVCVLAVASLFAAIGSGMK